MPRTLHYFGPPGSGKTHTLTDIYIKLVQALGDPSKVAVVTYTRTAAAEFRLRAAQALGIYGPPATLQKQLPHIGTIHALSYRLTGKHRLVNDDWVTRWAASCGYPPPSSKDSDDEGVVRSDPLDPHRANLTDLALRLSSISNHRLKSPIDCLADLPAEAVERIGANPIVLAVSAYRTAKVEDNVWDYEDLAGCGAYQRLPVEALLVDEAQDNSPLLWRTIKAWALNTKLFITAGDPWQSLYVYNGAVPWEYRTMEGTWKSLGKSYRLSDPSVEYARRILKSAGWDDPLIDSWYGRGGLMADGTTLYLGRTHAIVDDIRGDLIRRGVPFRQLSGKGPLDTAPGQVYQTLTRLTEGQVVPAGMLRAALLGLSQEKLERLGIPSKRAISRLPEDDVHVSVRDVELLAGRPIDQVLPALSWASYFKKIRALHGVKGILDRPTNVISTVHCSPPNEPVLTTRGFVCIGDLREDDRLMSWHSQTRAAKLGYSYTKRGHPYTGDLLVIRTEGSSTRVTPNHIMKAYYSPKADALFLVYLMRKGMWWRLGQTRMRRMDGETTYGITRRMGNEVADVAWIVGVHASRQEAIYHEALLAATYGIPATRFAQHPGRVPERLPAKELERIYDAAALSVGRRAEGLLADLGLLLEFPFYTRGDRSLRSDTRMFDICAANLIPEIMVVPIVGPDDQLRKVPFSVTREPYSGEVFDLEVPPYQHYISGGLLVHNSAKGREADNVILAQSWGRLPLQTYTSSEEGRRNESCVAYVAATRHRVSLEFIPARSGDGAYPYPVR